MLDIDAMTLISEKYSENIRENPASLAKDLDESMTAPLNVMKQVNNIMEHLCQKNKIKFCITQM